MEQEVVGLGVELAFYRSGAVVQKSYLNLNP